MTLEMVSTQNDISKLNALWKWAIANGAKLDNIKPFVDENPINRGVKATRKLSLGESIACVPRKLLITETNARQSGIGLSLEKYFSLPEHKEFVKSLPKRSTSLEGMLHLALFVFHEKHINQESFWKPYLDSLPENYDDIPITWSFEKIDALIGRNTNLAKILKYTNGILKQAFDISHMACKDYLNASNTSDKDLKLKSLTFENFLEAYCTVCSRAFPNFDGITTSLDKSDTSSKGKASECEISLWPVLDMCNHKLYQKIEWNTVKSANDIHFVTCVNEINENDEILSNYGAKGNEVFFGNFGFVLSKNPDDFTKIAVNVMEQDSLCEPKKALLEKNNSILQHMLFECEEFVSKQLMMVMRILSLNSYELENYQHHDFMTSLNPRNGLSALSNLYTLLNGKYNELMGDYSTKDHSDSSYHSYLGQVYVKGQLGILKHYMSLVVDAFSAVVAKFNNSNNNGNAFSTAFYHLENGIPSAVDEGDLNWIREVAMGGLDQDSILAILVSQRSHIYSETEVENIVGDFKLDIQEHFREQVWSIVERTTCMPKKTTMSDFLYGSAVLETSEVSLSKSLLLVSVFGENSASLSSSNDGQVVHGVFLS